MRNDMKRAVITGATGAIGTALINELISNGVEVLVVTRRESKRNGVLPVHPLVKTVFCPLEEIASLEGDGSPYDVFYHFAWGGTTGKARNDMYLQNLNVRYALDAVKAAKALGCRTFIGAGSQAEYGRTKERMTPQTPVFPETGYGMAKLCAGQMTRELAHSLGLRHIWTRVLSVYGENDGESSMVSSTVKKLKGGERPVFTSGSQSWDYLYSGDAARAFYLLGEKGIDGKTYVVASGKDMPLRNYIEILRDVVSPGAELGFGEYKTETEPLGIRADISELTLDTGFAPSVDFAEGIRRISEKYDPEQ